MDAEKRTSPSDGSGRNTVSGLLFSSLQAGPENAFVDLTSHDAPVYPMGLNMDVSPVIVEEADPPTKASP